MSEIKSSVVKFKFNSNTQIYIQFLILLHIHVPVVIELHVVHPPPISIHWFIVQGPELLNKYIGASEQAIRNLFTRCVRVTV